MEVPNFPVRNKVKYSKYIYLLGYYSVIAVYNYYTIK